ncbi:MAG: zinc-ribbon domain-containing protein [Nitrososphaerota archaeon]|nr:zinc-ribbon domain-containing protein [Nitrososphaerota archaeon]
MRFCSYCGASLPDDAGFCSSCGKPVAVALAASTPLPEPQAPHATLGETLLLSTKDLVLNKKILSVREHYDIQTTSGTPLGEAEGNFFQFPARFAVQDANGAQVMHVEGKLISLRREFGMYDSAGNLLAAIKKKIVKLVGSEYWLEVGGDQFARIYGNFVEHDYRIQIKGVDVAQVHKKWVSVRDSFNISVSGSVDQRLVLGSVIVIEHEEVTERRR